MGGSVVIRTLSRFVNPYEILDDPLGPTLEFGESYVRHNCKPSHYTTLIKLLSYIQCKDQWSDTMPLAMTSICSQICCKTTKRGTWLCFGYKCLTCDPLRGSHRDEKHLDLGVSL